MAKGYRSNRPGPYWKEALKGGSREEADDERPRRGKGAEHPLRKKAAPAAEPGQRGARPARGARAEGPVWGQRGGEAGAAQAPGGRPARAGQAAKAPRPARAGRPPRPGAARPDDDADAGAAAPVAPAAPRLDGSGHIYITLVQWLKRTSTSGTGGEGKHTVRAGGILVNGAEELRPGRKLHAGDTVTIAGKTQTVTL